MTHHFLRKASLTVKDRHLYLLMKLRLQHTYNLKITQRCTRWFLHYANLSPAWDLSCPKLSLPLRPSLLSSRKARGDFTCFHVPAAEVAEELAGRQDCWGWRGWAGPAGCAAGPAGCASRSWAPRPGCWALRWETKEANAVRMAFDKGQQVARVGSSASSHDSGLWFFQFLLGFKTTP